MDDARAQESAEAVDAFADYLTVCERGEAPDFGAFCGAHSELAGLAAFLGRESAGR